jgi:hypothetical protein
MAITIPAEGYCQTTDVTRLTGKEYKNAATGIPVTKPSLDQCEEMIKQTADTINGVLAGVGISIPVAATATRSQRIVGRLNALGAAVAAENAVPGISETVGRAAVWQDEFNTHLRMLADKRLTLPDAAMSSTEMRPAYGMSPDSYGDTAEPFFSRSDEV